MHKQLTHNINVLNDLSRAKIKILFNNLTQLIIGFIAHSIGIDIHSKRFSNTNSICNLLKDSSMITVIAWYIILYRPEQALVLPDQQPPGI